jgi:hypothetical protein
MASYPTLVAGTAKTWQASGGDYALTLTSLASSSTAGREGAKGDLYDATNARLPALVVLTFETKMTSAPTDATVLELWIGESASATAGTGNPGGLTGADAAITNLDQRKRQLNFAGSLSLSNNIGTGVQRAHFAYYPAHRYLVPAAFNNSGTALSGTAGDHILTMTPYYWQVG